jgi:chaperonin GroEL
MPLRPERYPQGGVAIIRLGGHTEIEVKEREDRVDDALHATRAAVEEGIVPGGGVALARAALVLTTRDAPNHDQKFGIEIVRRAISVPLRQIAANAGEDGAVIAGEVLKHTDYAWGFDAQTATCRDMVAAGIIDLTKVVRSSLQHAASVGGLLITTGAMIGDTPADHASATATPAGMDY